MRSFRSGLRSGYVRRCVKGRCEVMVGCASHAHAPPLTYYLEGCHLEADRQNREVEDAPTQGIVHSVEVIHRMLQNRVSPRKSVELAQFVIHAKLLSEDALDRLFLVVGLACEEGCHRNPR